MNKIVTGIDVGTYHVKVVVAELADDPRQPPHVLGTGYAESRGLKQGYVVAPLEAAHSIGAAVNQASRAARVPIKKAYVSLSGVGLNEVFSRGEAVVERGDSEIVDSDISRVIAASEKALPPGTTLNQKTIHTIPLHFTVDGVRVMGTNPVGMKGMRIAVETLFITYQEVHMRNLVEAVEAAGVEVEDFVAGPIAASFVALTKTQKRLGSILVNIGSETLSTVVFEDTRPVSIKIFPIGGANITNDLALGLRISPEEAEQLKMGAVLGGNIPKKKVDDITHRRLTEIFKYIEAHLKKINRDELLPGGVVLTGGGASVVGISEIAKAVLRLPSRIASLSESNATQMQLGDNLWATAYGLTIWGFTHGGDIEHHGDSNFRDTFKNFWRWAKKFLP
ncbi:MAG: cell division protein FtsA [bacterium]